MKIAKYVGDIKYFGILKNTEPPKGVKIVCFTEEEVNDFKINPVICSGSIPKVIGKKLNRRSPIIGMVKVSVDL